MTWTRVVDVKRTLAHPAWIATIKKMPYLDQHEGNERINWGLTDAADEA